MEKAVLNVWIEKSAIDRIDEISIEMTHETGIIIKRSDVVRKAVLEFIGRYDNGR